MAKRRRNNLGLGKGLGAILSENTSSSSSNVGVLFLPLTQIETNPYQPRADFDEKSLEELTASIKVHGIIQPITVRKLTPKKYQLISGERRFRASKRAGLKEIPAFVRTANDEQMLEMALIENIQRKDLNPIEIAISYRRLVEELKLKQEDLGHKVGKGRTTVANYMRLLKLPAEIQAALKNPEEAISMGHARALINIEDKQVQLALFQKIIDNGLSVRQTEQLVRQLKNKDQEEKEKPKRNTLNDIHLKRVAQKLTDKFGNKVAMKQRTNGKGEIKIPFNSTEDLNRILEILEFKLN